MSELCAEPIFGEDIAGSSAGPSGSWVSHLPIVALACFRACFAPEFLGSTLLEERDAHGSFGICQKPAPISHCIVVMALSFDFKAILLHGSCDLALRHFRFMAAVTSRFHTYLTKTCGTATCC